jgi:hypothetical protein
MSDRSLPPTGRRSFLGRLGLVAALASAAAATKAAAQTARQRFEPALHEEDAWMELPGTHRALIDAYTGWGGVNAMNYASNLMVTHKDVYKGAESDYAIIVCFRSQAAPLAYSDAIWEKYGKPLSDYVNYQDPKTQANFPLSPLNMSDRVDLPSRGHTLSSNAARGVQYAVCSRATRNLSTILAAATGGSVDEIFQELAGSIGVNARMVPAGVVATTRAQERGYTMLVAG